MKETAPGVFEVLVRDEAAENAANMRVCEILANHFKVPVKAVRIVTGHHRPSKKIQVVY